ncbi:MAG TPA: tetraacyldisaccharide 4'-kinase [Beijerinckiaceae bacterium]|nr:tetraacyldisaccharide 4'-kinase [Beijerinckiaceae bacterium]
MRAPAFWWRPHSTPASILLRAPAALYGAIAARRMRARGQRAPLPVACIGNFTVGGSGKTPAALAVAAMLAGEGHHPVFLTRGYGGRLAGPVRVDAARHAARDVGDEPLLLARAFPVVVSRDRPAGAQLCAAEGASVIVMDDGLQNPSLVKNLALAVVDGASGVGNGLCLPAGPLRAPLAAQWPHVHAVVVVGDGAPGEAVAGEARRRGAPVLRARLEAEATAAARLRGQRVLAFAGIGRPEKFYATLAACGADVVRTRSFPDHHPFAAAEIGALVAAAAAENLAPVTTEKDLVRIAGLSHAASDAERIQALPVRLAFEDARALRELMAARLSAVGAA